MRHRYGLSDYDAHLCLKPPLLLWVAVLFLARTITLPLAIAAGYFAGVGADTLALLRGLWNIDTLLPSLIAAAVLYAMLRRAPGASRTVRWIWRRGRVLLASAAAFDLVVSLVPLGQRPDFNELMLGLLLVSGFDVYFMVYVLAAPRVRDTFGDFPQPVASTGTRVSSG